MHRFLLVLLASLFAMVGRSVSARVFDIRDHGAVGDGQTLETAAIQRAIDEVSAAGGGQVRVPPGTYLTGSIHLRSRLTLFLEAGARLVGTTNLSEYRQPSPPEFMPEARWGRWHRGLLIGENLEDVTLEFTGGGQPEAGVGEVRGPGVDARRLPAWGLYARGVENLVLDNVRLRLAQDDRRPVFLAEDIGVLNLETFLFPEIPGTPEVFRWKEVREVRWPDGGDRRPRLLPPPHRP